MEENKPLSANPSESDVSSEAGEGHVENQQANTPEAEAQPSAEQTDKGLNLEDLNKMAGRDGDRAFKTRKDFEKHYGELSSYVGKKVEAEKVQKAAEAKEEVDAKAEALTEADKIAALNVRLDEESFLRRHPDVEEGSAELDLIKKYADQSNTTLDEAYKEETLSTLLKDLKVGREKRESETAIESNQRLATNEPKLSPEIIKAASMGNTHARREVIREMVLPKIRKME